MEDSPLSRRRLLWGAAGAAGTALVAVGLPQLMGPDEKVKAAPPTPARKAPGAARPPATLRRDPSVDYAPAVWIEASESNYTPSDRPEAYPIEYVVIHLTTDILPIMLATFKDPEERVSAHYVISSTGTRIAQCVRERDVAWHSGNVWYNHRSIGIEHEGWLDQPLYTDAMYEASAVLTATICAKYDVPVDRDHILGHIEVPESTHEDPGDAWNWNKYMKLVETAHRRIRT
ncbi:N-acetylmuramoyl-L-alanine amidase [Streptomyces sp. APSN-46.1]|uniref:N-acetylmuramoyl-L-alanine amidase n=1 Tax=Streptomyces sp. APSN-46.1 TaxID=2929049 RepID=UPI001FB397B9|nr:peptidoglycan recognition family protein [Streptomyces sp. APSN-46.1]MCJ1676354.1 N-acetylmuramoyl-L-alanine amidase [Streptomyces sp. APSN-46.1]